MDRIYFDHAASTPTDAAVLDKILPLLRENFANPSALHGEGRKAKAALEAARKQIANCMGVASNEIYFTSSATEANNMVIKSAIHSQGIQTIISSPIEHPCVENSIIAAQKLYPNLKVQYLRCLPSGRVDAGHLSELLAADGNKKLVTVIHAHNELGTLNPIEQIAQLCEQHGSLFHTDMVQTAARLPFPKQYQPHYAVASGHKIGGIKGAGLLYISKKAPLRAFIDGGGQERGLRAGTENLAAAVAFAEAWQIQQQEQAQRAEKLLLLKRAMVEKLAVLLPSIDYNGDTSPEGSVPHILNLKIPCKLPLPTLLFKLDLLGLSVSAGSACSAGAVVASATSKFLSLPAGFHPIRLSFSHQNSLEEVEKAAAIIAKVALG